MLNPLVLPLAVGLSRLDSLLHHAPDDLPFILPNARGQAVAELRSFLSRRGQNVYALVNGLILRISDVETVGIAALHFVLECAKERGPRRGADVHVRLHALNARPGEQAVHQHPVGIDGVRQMDLHADAQGRCPEVKVVVTMQLDVLDVLTALGRFVQRLDLLDEGNGMVLLRSGLHRAAGAQLVTGEPIVSISAERVGEVEIAMPGRIDVDGERIHAAIEVQVHAENEPAVGIDRAIARQHDIAAVEPADPVQGVFLGVALHHDIPGESEAPIHQRPVNGARMRAAAGLDELEDAVVRVDDLQTASTNRSADRGLVGDPPEDVRSGPPVRVVQPNGVGEKHLATAGLALEIPSAVRLGTSALSIFVAV